jgi:hypothetical protein
MEGAGCDGYATIWRVSSLLVAGEPLLATLYPGTREKLFLVPMRSLMISFKIESTTQLLNDIKGNRIYGRVQWHIWEEFMQR